MFIFTIFSTSISTFNSNLFTLFCLQDCCPSMCTAVCSNFFVYKVVALAYVLQFIYIFCLQGCCPCMCTAVYYTLFFYNVVVLTYVLQFIYIILFTRLLSLHVYCSWRNQRKHFKKMLRERSLIENTPYHSQHTLSRRYTSV